jgi:hypothetical protein
MAYCTISDLTPFLVDPLTDRTKPTLDQATAFIADVDGLLNMAMDKVGMDTPPTDANVLLWLKNASRNGVLAMIETAKFTQTGTNRSDRTTEYQRKFDDAIKQIKSSPSSIGGATRIEYVMPDAADNMIEDADTVMY